MTMKLLCIAILASAVSAQHTMGGVGMHHGNASASNASLPIPDSCVTNPTQANCTNFKYPHANAVADLNSLCTAMHFMGGCSVAKACNASGAGPDNPTGAGAANVSSNDGNACRVFHQVATVCRHDTGMSRMKGCTNYNTMCVNGSRVPQCQNMTGIATIPPTRVLNERVRSICEQMPNHTGCDLCLPSWKANQTWGDCDLLTVYGTVCGEMPDMEECAEWRETCTADRSLWVCENFPKELVVTATDRSVNATVPAAAAAPAKSAAAVPVRLSAALLSVMMAAVALLA